MKTQLGRGRWLTPTLVILALVAAGCGGSSKNGSAGKSSSPGTGSGTPAASSGTFKVALILPSATNDLAFSESMYNAVESLKAAYHLQVSVQDNMFVVADAANAIRQYAAEGYKLVIADGSQYGSTLQQLAPQFPHVSFAWGTAGSTFNQPNIFAYQVYANEGGYVQGYMAGLLSKSHVIGEIGPIDVGDGQLYSDGFKAGALAADPKASVHVTFTGSFSDTSLFASAARSYISERADMLSGSAQAVVGAIGVARADHVAWFANDWDQASLAPQEVVSSNQYNWTGVLRQMFTAIRAGTLGGATYTATLGNGGTRIVFNPSYPLPAAVKAKAQQLISKIVSGQLTIAQ